MGGCATARPTSPVEVAAAWADAQRLGDRAAASRLEAPGAGAGLAQARPAAGAAVEVSRRAVWQSNQHELAVTGAGLARRLESGVLGLSRATTPDEALALLGRALVAGDFGLLLELLPAAERPRWDAERLAARVASADGWGELGRALVSAAVVAEWDGSARAKARVGVTVVHLEREEEGWKVVDLTPRDAYAPRPVDGVDPPEVP